MHNVSSEFDERLQSETSTFCRLCRITRKDGNVLRLTDHDSNVMHELQTYRADVGVTVSAVYASSIGGSTQGVELDVALTEDGISNADIRSRVYVGATVEIMVLDYEHPSAGVLQLFRGRVGRISITDRDHATVEVLPFTSQSVQIANETYSSTCRASLGDNRCKFNIEATRLELVVTAVLDRVTFDVASMPDREEDYYTFGQLKWVTGKNEGQVSDIRTSNSSLKRLGLFYPLPFPIAVGDTGFCYAGCDLQFSTCRDKFQNKDNFRGEIFVPTWSS